MFIFCSLLYLICITHYMRFQSIAKVIGHVKQLALTVSGAQSPFCEKYEIVCLICKVRFQTVFYLLMVFWEYVQRSKHFSFHFSLQFSTETVKALLSPHPLFFKSWYSPSHCGFLLKMDCHREWGGGNGMKCGLWFLCLGPCCENTVPL